MIRDREIVGKVDPLDVDDLVTLGETHAWVGLPAATRIGHVHLFIGDLEAAARFYHDGLGFDRVGWSFPGALFLSAGGYHHHVGLNTWAAGAPPAGEDDARLVDWELVCGEPGAVTQNLEQRGFIVEPSDDGSIARDPWGIAVRVTNDEAGWPGQRES